MVLLTAAGDPDAFYGTLPQWFEAIFMLLTFVVAFAGLWTWRQATIGKREIELAEDVLAAFYEAREIFRFARSPVGFLGEGESRPKLEGEAENLKELLNTYFIPLERLNENAAFFSDLRAKQYRFIAYFGDEGAKAFDHLVQVRNDIQFASHMLSEFAKSPPRSEQDVQLERQYRFNQYYIPGRDDDLDKRIDSAVKIIEDICRPVLKSRSGLLPEWTAPGAKPPADDP